MWERVFLEFWEFGGLRCGKVGGELVGFGSLGRGCCLVGMGRKGWWAIYGLYGLRSAPRSYVLDIFLFNMIELFLERLAMKT